MTERIVVIGADAARMSAASQTKRIGGDAVEIVAFERGTYSSYAACGIPCWVAGDVDEPERLIARSPDAHRRNGIDLHLRTEVEEIDLAAADAAGVFGVQTLDDGAALLADLDHAQPRRAVVVGGGYIGVQMQVLGHDHVWAGGDCVEVLIAREPGRLGDERRLADAGLPHDKESSPVFVQRPERLVKAPQFGDAA